MIKPGHTAPFARTIALAALLFAVLVVAVLTRHPGESVKGRAPVTRPEATTPKAGTPGESAPSGDSRQANATPQPGSGSGNAPAPIVLGKADSSASGDSPVPPSFDLTRLSLPPRKGNEPPSLILPPADYLEALFESEVGEVVRVNFGDTLRFTGEVLRKETQPGTKVLGLSAANEISTLHLERTRRGSYRGSIIHKDSSTAHRLGTREDGTFLIEQVSFHHLVCAAPGSTPQAILGLPVPAGVPAETQPEEAGISEATPPTRDSRPGATAVIYLDFDGQSVSGTEWNTLKSVTTINAAASNLTTNEMDEVWKRIAEDFAPFNVSVTTNTSRYTAAPQNRRIRVIITPSSSWYGSAGGVAYLGSFTWTGDTPCWVFENLLGDEVKSIAEAASHEAGHTFNLKHDGRGAEEYYYGVDNSVASWGPIMGAGYNAAFTQWSKGEYSSATNLEDDLAILTNATNGFGYRTDDKGDTLATAPSLALQSGSSTLVADGGIVEKNTDIDLMRFSAGAGSVSLQVRPAAVSPNLFLKADLLDGNGTVLLSRTATKAATTLTLSLSVTAGTYYLRVDGAGMPVAAGSAAPYAYDVSGYGSVGEYAVSGSIPVSSAPGVLSVSPSTITQSSPAGQNAGSQSFNVRNAGGGSVNYTISESIAWLSVSPASGSSSGADSPHSLTYATTGLAAGTYNGSITVTATGVSGSPQTVDVTLTVTPTGSGLTYSNLSAIAIPASGSTSSATPYASEINVSGVTQNLAAVSVELFNAQHAWTNDLDLLLVAPNGQTVMLLSDAGSDQPFSGGSANLVFRDDASAAPENAALASGSYRPTNYGTDDVLPAPAPAGPHGATLAPLLNGGVNGIWKLFVADDFPSSDGGQIAGGWALTFVASSGPGAPTGVTATDGTFTDKVRVNWSASNGATGYEVFRSLVNNPAGAQSLGTTVGTSFDDTGTLVGETHYYWVKASHVGGTSPFSASDSGYRGAVSTNNDSFANRTVLTGTSATATAPNGTATKESGEPNHAGNTGGKSLWWSWTAPQAGTLTVDTAGSSFDTLLGVYTGSGVSALTTRGSDDDSGGNLTSRTVVQVTGGTTYAIAIDGYGGASGTANFNLAFVPSAQLPSPPPSMSASDGAFTDRVRVTWTAGTGADSYEVRRHTNATFASATLLGTVAALTFDDTTAVAGTTYHYWIVSRNSAGSSTSPAGPDTGFRAVALSNDNFANRGALSGNSATATGDNSTASKQVGEPDHAGNEGGRSLWWKWTAPSAGTLTVDTIGSSFDTLLGVYTGTAVGSLVPRATDDDSGGNYTSRVSLAVTGSTEYQIAVDGYGGESGSVKVQLSFTPSALPPSPASGVSASDATFTDRVRVSWTAGAGATSYDIHRHTSSSFAASTLIGNITAAPYDDTTAVAGTTYRYWVVSRNSAGTASAAGPDNGTRLASAANTAFANRTVLSGNSVSATGSNLNGGKEPGEPDHGDDAGGNSLWWSWTAPEAGTLTVDTFGSDFDTTLGVYTGASVSSLETEGSNDDFNGSTSRVVVAVTGGTSYHIAVDGMRAATGNVQLHLAFQPEPTTNNDDFADRLPLNGEILSVTSENRSATREAGEPNHGGTAVGKSLWWTWNAPSDGILVVDTFGSSFDTTLGIYTGNILGSLSTEAESDDSETTFTSVTAIYVTAGTDYAIAVDGFNGVSGDVLLNLFFTSDPFAPDQLSARAVNRSQISLSWSGGLNATAYVIERRDPFSRRWRVVGSVPGTVETFTATRLRPRTFYAFRVRAYNGAEASAPSPLAGARTRGR